MPAVGRPMTREERRTRSFKTLITETRKFVRKDFGGQSDHIKQIRKKCKEFGYHKDVEVPLVETIIQIIDDQLDGVRKRQKNMLSEMERRILGE